MRLRFQLDQGNKTLFWYSDLLLLIPGCVRKGEPDTNLSPWKVLISVLWASTSSSYDTHCQISWQGCNCNINITKVVVDPISNVASKWCRFRVLSLTVDEAQLPDHQIIKNNMRVSFTALQIRNKLEEYLQNYVMGLTCGKNWRVLNKSK